MLRTAWSHPGGCPSSEPRYPIPDSRSPTSPLQCPGVSVRRRRRVRLDRHSAGLARLDGVAGGGALGESALRAAGATFRGAGRDPAPRRRLDRVRRASRHRRRRSTGDLRSHAGRRTSRHLASERPSRRLVQSLCRAARGGPLRGAGRDQDRRPARPGRHGCRAGGAGVSGRNGAPCRRAGARPSVRMRATSSPFTVRRGGSTRICWRRATGCRFSSPPPWAPRSRSPAGHQAGWRRRSVSSASRACDGGCNRGHSRATDSASTPRGGDSPGAVSPPRTSSGKHSRGHRSSDSASSWSGPRPVDIRRPVARIGGCHECSAVAQR